MRLSFNTGETLGVKVGYKVVDGIVRETPYDLYKSIEGVLYFDLNLSTLVYTESPNYTIQFTAYAFYGTPASIKVRMADIMIYKYGI